MQSEKPIHPPPRTYPSSLSAMSAMPSVTLGFTLAGLYNLGIVSFSRGFSNTLGAVDPLFDPSGCVLVLLWGLAFLSVRRAYAAVPLLSGVFILEKAYYVAHWVAWMQAHAAELPAMAEKDPITAFFFTFYGIGDALSFLFFAHVAWICLTR